MTTPRSRYVNDGLQITMISKVFSKSQATGLLTPILAGIVLAILAPFGTDNLSIIMRLAYWVGLTLAGGLGAMAIDIVLRRYAPQTRLWVWALLQSIGATLAVAPFVLYLHTQSGWESILLSLFYIWVVAIVITAFGQLIQQRSVPETDAPKRSPLLDRLPPKFRDATLYAISSEDHYIRIHSEAGEHMLLMRLTDAEDLAAPLTGLKPHRSWWVAEAGVEEIIKTNGKLQIHLKSDVSVPVSREGAKRVRDANWV